MNRLVFTFIALSLLLASCTSTPAQDADPAGVLVTEAPTSVEAATQSAPPADTLTPTEVPTMTIAPTRTDAVKTEVVYTIEEVIDFEMRGAFDFFWEQANTDSGSKGFGLIRDRFPGSEGIASIASVGFGLTAYTIGVEKGYISFEDGLERASKTLDTLLGMERVEGFFYHFVEMQTGKRAWNSEVSTIDTSILLMGVLSAGQYFGGEVGIKAKALYDGVNWPWFIDESKDMFYMAYRPEKGFEGYWDFYAEQLMVYILAAGSDTHPIDEITYYTFIRDYRKYGDGKPFIHSWFHSIFTYQFSHAWVDFRNYIDREGVNWFDNSVEASLAHYNFAVKMEPKYETLGPDAWGLTASDGPDGYNGRYGAPPSGYDNRMHFIDDTIAPAGAIGSIIFLPEQTERAMLNYYSIPELKGDYGFLDAYNLTEDWYATDVIGIDKGISLLMLANYENGHVYNIMMENQNILQGLERLQITKDNS